MPLMTELKGHSMKQIDQNFYLSSRYRPSHYGDASTDPHGAAGICVLIPDTDLKENVRTSNRENTTGVDSVTIKKEVNSSDTLLSSSNILHQIPSLS